MPLKPIYHRPPLMDAKTLALRAGQAHTEDSGLRELYAALCGNLCPETLEAAVRTGYLVKKEAHESEPIQMLLAILAEQREDGSLRLNAFESLRVMRAALALVEAEADRGILEKIIRWCGFLGQHQDEWLTSDGLRAAPADWLDLFLSVYSLTGKKALLQLCQAIRSTSMDWSSILRTFSVRKPLAKALDLAAAEAGAEEEKWSPEGFYTRQLVAGNAVMLADGIRAATCHSRYIGSATDADAAEISFARIKHYHGSAAGGMTASDLLMGSSPAEPVSVVSVSAWAEALAQQVVLGGMWAADELEILFSNAFSAALRCPDCSWQMVNVLSNPKPPEMALSFSVEESIHAVHEAAKTTRLSRLGRAAAAVYASAVTMKEDGCAINLFLPGRYRLPIAGHAACLILEKTGTQDMDIRIQLRSEVRGNIEIRVPSWCRAMDIIVAGENPVCGEAGTWYKMNRLWKPGDVIHIRMGETLRTVSSYHQGLAVYDGPILLAMPIRQGDHLPCAVGEPSHDGEKTLLPIRTAKDWDLKNGQPRDLPVRPACEGPVRSVALYPITGLEGHIGLFPMGAET